MGSSGVPPPRGRASRGKVKEGRDDKGDRHGKSLLLTQELVGNITELYLELLWGQHSSHSTCLCVGIVTSKDLRVENLGNVEVMYKCPGCAPAPRRPSEALPPTVRSTCQRQGGPSVDRLGNSL